MCSVLWVGARTVFQWQRHGTRCETNVSQLAFGIGACGTLQDVILLRMILCVTVTGTARRHEAGCENKVSPGHLPIEQAPWQSLLLCGHTRLGVRTRCLLGIYKNNYFKKELALGIMFPGTFVVLSTACCAGHDVSILVSSQHRLNRLKGHHHLWHRKSKGVGSLAP